MPAGCVFCDIVLGRLVPAYPLAADERLFAMLSDDWAVRGHAVVVWKEHVENLSDLTPADASHLAEVFRRTEKTLLAETGMERSIILKLGLQVPHLHLHIYPVSKGHDRRAVFEAFDARSSDASTPEERERFADAVRQRLLLNVE